MNWSEVAEVEECHIHDILSTFLRLGFFPFFCRHGGRIHILKKKEERRDPDFYRVLKR